MSSSMFSGKLGAVGDISATLKTVGAKVNGVKRRASILLNQSLTCLVHSLQLGDTVHEKTRSLQSHLEETFEVRGEKSAAQLELEKWQAEMSIGNIR